MPFENGRLVAWKVAVCALVRFLPSVNEGVSLQMSVLTKWLVALWTTILLDPTVDEGMGLKCASITNDLYTLGNCTSWPHCTMCILGTTMALWSKAEIQKYTFWWGKNIFEAIFLYCLGRNSKTCFAFHFRALETLFLEHSKSVKMTRKSQI